MSAPSSLPNRLRASRVLALFRGARLDPEMNAQMRAHLERGTALGGWGLRIAVRDLLVAGRTLYKNPAFTAAAVLTLGLGIGLATTLFSVLHALVISPFPYGNPDQIVYVRSNTGQPLSTPDFEDIRKRSESFVELGVYSPIRVNLGTEPPESIAAIGCTAGVLRALGVRPVLGRWLDANDEPEGAPTVAVISHALWVRAFGGDAGILGREIRLDGRPAAVVGVMPQDFEFTSPWYAGHDYELWTPLRVDPQHQTSRGSHWLLGIGRLKPGVTVAAADAEIKIIGARLASEYPTSNTKKPLLVRSLREEITRETSSGMRPLGGAVALLMLVACANVAGLLLARGAQRRAEFGVRLAMGASRGVLVRQLLSETFLLGWLGSAAGIVFAAWGVEVFRQWIPPALIIEARRAAIQVDGGVLLAAIALGSIAALIAGVHPALSAARTPLAETLSDGERTQTDSRHRRRFLSRLAVAQIAASVLLAHAAILFAGSYLEIFKTNQTLDTDGVLAAAITAQGPRYLDVGTRGQFWRTLLDRVRAVPGVQHVGMTTKLPLEGGSNFAVLVDDQVFDPAIRRPLVENSGVSPDYFAAMGLGWVRGDARSFLSPRGEATPVIINQAMVRRCWPESNPIGRHVRINMTERPVDFEVIGVVEDARQWGAESDPRPELYYPATMQAAPDEAVPFDAYLVLRANGDARALVPAIRRELAATDSGLPLADIRTMREVLRNAGSRRRLSTGLTGVFMVATLALAAIGVYGTLSYLLSQRTRELGVRIALGARRGQIFGLVMRQAGAWILGGLAIGLALAAASSLLLRSLVYATDPLDPALLLIGSILVGGVMIVACLSPARRASRVDPIAALRAD